MFIRKESSALVTPPDIASLLLGDAINLITALNTILPDAIISIISEVTRHLKKVQVNARILGTGIQANTRV